MTLTLFIHQRIPSTHGHVYVHDIHLSRLGFRSSPPPFPSFVCLRRREPCDFSARLLTCHRVLTDNDDDDDDERSAVIGSRAVLKRDLLPLDCFFFCLSSLLTHEQTADYLRTSSSLQVQEIGYSLSPSSLLPVSLSLIFFLPAVYRILARSFAYARARTHYH